MMPFTPDASRPMLIFGGPYSNLAATQAIQNVSKQLQIPSGNILCTGDIVAYCASAQETTDLIRDWGITVVQGNCEESLANNANDCGCGFNAGSTCDLLSAGWFNYAKPKVNTQAKQWMGELPLNIEFEYAKTKMLAIHGGLNSINQFVFASDDITMEQQLNEAAVDVIIGGHCGLPFGQQLSNGFWLNAGVIGMPANNGQTDTWYMLLTADADGHITASWHILEYDVADSIHKMQQAGLNTPYAEALKTGLWPSTDILPNAETSATGHTINIPNLQLNSPIA